MGSLDGPDAGWELQGQKMALGILKLLISLALKRFSLWASHFSLRFAKQ